MWRNQGFHILLAVMSNGAVTLKKADLQTQSYYVTQQYSTQAYTQEK